MKYTIAILAVLVASAAAHCPNQCSGHGNCGSFDKCDCWPNWQGADCSLRTCAYGNAWAVDHAHDAHYYAECSNKGLCDRSTGLCECFDGYTGRACTRSVCPNDCSGHGKCRLVRDLNAVSSNDANAYTGWDADMIQTCICDGGFQGADCSERKCQTGDDLLTSCAPDPTNEVQRLVLNWGNNETNVDTINDELALVFTDNLGNTFKTRKIEGITSPNGAANIKSALEGLPNFAIPSVSVTREVMDNWEAGARNGNNNTVIAYQITFTGIRNSGNQSLLSCESTLGCTNPGCQPMYRQARRERTTLAQGATVGSVMIHNDSVIVSNFHNERFQDGTIEVMVYENATDAVHGEPYNQFSVRTSFPEYAGVNPDIFVNYGFIPNDFSKVEISNGVYIAFESRTAQRGLYTFEYRVPKCEVESYTPAATHAENIECGGRGVCDRSTGTCDCFEGWYGNSCGSQSILV